MIVLAVLVAVVLAGFFAGGFIRFASAVTGDVSGPAPIGAEGIVVLTGGTDRVSGAVSLLAEGKAQRLLISGVHPSTTPEAIRSRLDAGENLFSCCIDLDHVAVDTVGNAAETAKWARNHGFSSLIVVTSSYHMPRSLAELNEIMPETRLIPYTVASPRIARNDWFRSARTTRLLLREYVKYLAARTRLILIGPMTADLAPAPQDDSLVDFVAGVRTVN